MQTANWIKHGFREVDAPTHVAIFDLAERRCPKAIDLEPRGINILLEFLMLEGKLWTALSSKGERLVPYCRFGANDDYVGEVHGSARYASA
jgi:hypothetical protein